MNLEDKINIINQAVCQYFKDNPEESIAKPKDLVKYTSKLMSDSSKGLSIRNVLRTLKANKTLAKIPSVVLEEKEIKSGI